jgi:hypothetical protein
MQLVLSPTRLGKSSAVRNSNFGDEGSLCWMKAGWLLCGESREASAAIPHCPQVLIGLPPSHFGQLHNPNCGPVTKGLFVSLRDA